MCCLNSSLSRKEKSVIDSFNNFVSNNEDIKLMKSYLKQMERSIDKNNLNINYRKLSNNIFRFQGMVFIMKTTNMKTNKNEFKNFFTSKKIYRRIRKEKIVVLNYMKLSSECENTYKITHNVKKTIDKNSCKSYSRIKIMRYKFED